MTAGHGQQRAAMLEGVGRRLSGELRAFVMALPPTSRTSRTMAGYLELDRNLCQKVIAASQPELDSIRTLITVPGVKSLQELIAAGREHGMPRDTLDGVRAAVESFRQAMDLCGGTHSSLISCVNGLLLSRYLADGDSVEHIERRRAFNEVASELVGTHMSVTCGVRVLTPSRDEPGKYVRHVTTGFFGIRSRPGSVPLTVSAMLSSKVRGANTESAMPPEAELISGEWLQGRLIEAVCSKPVPKMSSKQPLNLSVRVLDYSDHSEPADLAVCNTVMALPLEEDGVRLSLTDLATLRLPARTLLMDFYIHKHLARAYRPPTVGTYIWSSKVEISDPSEHWFDRLPGQLSAMPLEEGQGLPPFAGAEKFQMLVDETMRIAGEDIRDFQGYRLYMPEPICGTRIKIEFQPSEVRAE